ncbi:MAG: PEGA domain-containing protein [Patescibacteria group bacterium]
MKYIITSFVFIAIFMVGCDDQSGGIGNQPDSIISPDGPGEDTTRPPGTVKLSFESDPPGATIWVDDNESGKTTPGTVYVEAGCHEVGLTLNGYEQWTDEICYEYDMDLDPVTLETAADLLEEYRWLEGTWVRTDQYETGPRNVDVYVEERVNDPIQDGIYVVGFYPAEEGLPLERISETEIRLFAYYEPADLEWSSGPIALGDTEISIRYKSQETDKLFSYIKN